MTNTVIPIEESDLDPTTVKALALRKNGIPILHAAHAAGAELVDVIRAADAQGLLPAGEEELKTMTSRLAMKAGIRLEAMVDDPDQKFSPKELGVTMGIAADKAAKFGELEVKRETAKSLAPRLAAAAELLAKLHEQGGGTIEVCTQAPDGSKISGSLEVSGPVGPQTLDVKAEIE